MPHNFAKGQSLQANGDYRAASDYFAKAYRSGYNPLISLREHGNCKFFEAAFQLLNSPTILRKSVLISAARAFEDAIKQFGLDCECIYQLCCVEYSLGLLHNPPNGRTPKFAEYYDMLDDHYPSEIRALKELLPRLEETFT